MKKLMDFFVEPKEEEISTPATTPVVPASTPKITSGITSTYRSKESVQPTATPASEPLAESIDFEKVIWNGSIAEDSIIGKFFKMLENLKSSIPDEKTRVITALSMLETVTGTSKEQVLASLISVISELTADRVNTYEPQLVELQTKLVGSIEEQVVAVNEAIEADTALIKEIEERIHKNRVDKVTLETKMESGMRLYQTNVTNFEEKYNKILTLLNKLQVELG